MKLYVSQIEKLKDFATIPDKVIGVVNIFLNAINDWPHQIFTFDDFELEIHQLIGGPTTRENIESFLRNVDFKKNAWRAESLSQVLSLYNHYDSELTLKDILEELKLAIDFENLDWYK